MELKLYLRMLIRSWWIVALTALAALNVALFNAYLAVPQYSTQARFLVAPSKLLATDDFIRLLGDQTFIQTFAEIWNGNTNFDKTGAALQMAGGDLNDYTRTAVIAPSANVLELTVTGPNPVQAALIANTLGGFAMAEINDKYGAVVAVSVLDAAASPRRPFSPQPARDAGLAVALGLVIGAVLAIGREQLRIPLEALRRRTTIDSESSAFNHTHFQRSIDDELTRNRTGQVSLGLVQLSGLADLYENMPPLVKQRLMQYVTKTLQKELRGSDSVGRWTDTSFGVLLPATPTQPALRTLERIHRALTRPVEIDKGERLDLAPYVGVAVVSGDQSAITLITQAESALNDGRRSGQSLTLYADHAPATPEPVVMVEPGPSVAPEPTPSDIPETQSPSPQALEVEREVVYLETAQPDLGEAQAPATEIAQVESEIIVHEAAQLDLGEAPIVGPESPIIETAQVESEIIVHEAAQPDLDEAQVSEADSPEATPIEDDVAQLESAQSESTEATESPNGNASETEPVKDETN